MKVETGVSKSATTVRHSNCARFSAKADWNEVKLG